MRLDPHNVVEGTGILGRLSDELNGKGYSVNLFGVDTDLTALTGRRSDTVKRTVESIVGFQRFNPSADTDVDVDAKLTTKLRQLNKEGDMYNNFFSELVSDSMVRVASSVRYNELIIDISNISISKITNLLETNEFYFAQEHGAGKLLDKVKSDINIKRKLQHVAKMIGSHECRGSDRDIFHVQHHQYDHHNNLHVNLNYKLDEFNSAIKTFVNEMKNQNLWEDVAIVITSDFGRTLTMNTNKGTDHGWGGHSILMGGSIVGGRIFGEYPDDLSSKSPLHIGRGRLLPTKPWESMWSSVSEWLGVRGEESLNNVLPNRNSFPSSSMFELADLFDERASTPVIINCEDEGQPISCDPDFDGIYTSFPTESPTLMRLSSSNPSKSSSVPSSNPHANPSSLPSHNPSNTPSLKPSIDPSEDPSISPSKVNSNLPSTSPSLPQSSVPSSNPHANPSSLPSHNPSNTPSLKPSIDPSEDPSISPSKVNSNLPSTSPSLPESTSITVQPSGALSSNPTEIITFISTVSPSLSPSEESYANGKVKCQRERIFGKTFFVKLDRSCWRIQVKVGGNVASLGCRKNKKCKCQSDGVQRKFRKKFSKGKVDVHAYFQEMVGNTAFWTPKMTKRNIKNDASNDNYQFIIDFFALKGVSKPTIQVKQVDYESNDHYRIFLPDC